MHRKVEVYLHSELVGYLIQTKEQFVFEYLDDYRGKPIALSLPVEGRRFIRSELHPYFCSLAPEGWLKARYSTTQRIDEKDLLGFLIANGKNLIGAVQLRATGKEK